MHCLHGLTMAKHVIVLSCCIYSLKMFEKKKTNKNIIFNLKMQNVSQKTMIFPNFNLHIAIFIFLFSSSSNVYKFINTFV